MARDRSSSPFDPVAYEEAERIKKRRESSVSAEDQSGEESDDLDITDGPIKPKKRNKDGTVIPQGGEGEERKGRALCSFTRRWKGASHALIIT